MKNFNLDEQDWKMLLALQTCIDPETYEVDIDKYNKEIVELESTGAIDKAHSSLVVKHDGRVPESVPLYNYKAMNTLQTIEKYTK